MSPHKTVIINGRAYDAVTGMPVPQKAAETKKPATPPKPPAKAATSTSKSGAEAVHTTLQRSKTLHRRATKKPESPAKPVLHRSAPGRHMDIARSSTVSRFAAHPVAIDHTAKPSPKATSTPDTPAQVHPTAQRALHKATQKKAKPTQPTTAKQVKEAAISKAMAAPKASSVKKIAGPRFKVKKRFLIIGLVVIVLAAALYATFRFVPAVSVAIASAQAGIEASYPEYTPDGYSLSQPVTFSAGQVDLKFTSNSNDNYYTISQTRSSWDSSAVLDNIVTRDAGANYVTTKERGLTIYTYDSTAVWVNGGILYKIDSKAPLSGDQIRRIATSL
jgi:FlaG/FlaF family flagellin (archaellin)